MNSAKSNFQWRTVGWDCQSDCYPPLFKNFTNRPHLLEVQLVLETPLFLVLLLEHSRTFSLADYILDYDKVEQDNFLQIEEIVYIARDILGVLKEIHSLGKVLFSIKPENIYFTSECELICFIFYCPFLTFGKWIPIVDK